MQADGLESRVDTACECLQAPRATTPRAQGRLQPRTTPWPLRTRQSSLRRHVQTSFSSHVQGQRPPQGSPGHSSCGPQDRWQRVAHALTTTLTRLWFWRKAAGPWLSPAGSRQGVLGGCNGGRFVHHPSSGRGTGPAAEKGGRLLCRAEPEQNGQVGLGSTHRPPALGTPESSAERTGGHAASSAGPALRTARGMSRGRLAPDPTFLISFPKPRGCRARYRPCCGT